MVLMATSAKRALPQDATGNRNILNGNLLGGNTQPEELRDPGAEGIHEQAGEHQDADRRDRGQGEPSPAPSLDGDGRCRRAPAP